MEYALVLVELGRYVVVLLLVVELRTHSAEGDIEYAVSVVAEHAVLGDLLRHISIAIKEVS